MDASKREGSAAAGETQPVVNPEGREVKIGDIVGYVMDEERALGVIRPAMVVHVWSPETVQLQVFTDGDGGPYNDGTPNVIWKTSVMYREDTNTVGTWHWL